MRQTRPLEDVLREAVDGIQSLPLPEQEATVGAMLGLAYHYVDEAFAVALLEALKVANPLQVLLEENITKGLAQGMAQGMAQGELEGQRKSLRLFLRTRFGVIPASLEQRIAGAGVAELDELVARAATVERIESIDDAP